MVEEDMQEELETKILIDLNDLREIINYDKTFKSKAICACLVNESIAFIMCKDGTKFDLERITC